MIQKSLTTKIVISVAAIITIVIGVCTYIIVKVQTNELMEKAKRDGIFISHLIYQHIRHVMLTGNREEIRDLLLNIGQSREVRRIFVFDGEGRIFFSSNESEIGKKTDDLHQRLFAKDENPINFEIHEDRSTFSIVTAIQNKGECQICHGQKPQLLGALGLDISLVAAEKQIANNRNWIILFSCIILILVSAVISVLMMLLVKRPIRSLMRTMTEVERGNLKERVGIKRQDELGKLGKSFDSMIISLEQMEAELQRHHEQQIQQAEKLATIGELASSIAHEIKNPLAGISAAIQVISKEFDLKSTHQEVIEEIMQQMERLNKNTRDLLIFAKPAEPKLFFSNINEVIDKSTFFIRKRAEKQSIRITEDLRPNVPKVLIDPQQIQQVFLNIMLNAVQSMPEGGVLTIATRLSVNGNSHNSKTVDVSFTDTGRGIPQEQFKRIFNPFFTTKHRGTGLGLSISQKIIDKHCGHIEVESEIGKGTKVIVMIPANEEA
jgi:signal transduction histidine kinase